MFDQLGIRKRARFAGLPMPVDGAHQAAGVMLTEKGLAALNATPQGLSATVGSSLVKAASEAGSNWSGIGDLVGGALGGFTKSITSG